MWSLPIVCNPRPSLGRGLCNGRLNKWRQCNQQWYNHQLLSERLLIAKWSGRGLCVMEPCGRLNNSGCENSVQWAVVVSSTIADSMLLFSPIASAEQASQLWKSTTDGAFTYWSCKTLLQQIVLYDLCNRDLSPIFMYVGQVHVTSLTPTFCKLK